MIGQSVAQYRILESIGRGAMGSVYKAQDTRLGRFVAIKFLSEDRLGDQQALQRFHREGRALSALNHTYICTIYEVGDWEGRPYIAMELMEGETAKERIAAGPTEREELLKFAIQIATALEVAHSRNIIHRDIKPSNIFITKRGQTKLLDFGLAKIIRGEPKPLTSRAGSATMATEAISLYTLPGVVLGTLAYMPPEQARGERVDERADLYAFGMVLFEMATGRLPAREERGVGLPPDLEPIISKLIQREKEARYQSAPQVLLDLRRLKEQKKLAGTVPRLQRKVRRLSRNVWIGLGLIFLLLVLLGIYLARAV